jgi:hypothetical protein
MCASLLIVEPKTTVEETLDPILATTHDRWMADADQALRPAMESDATFSQRWAAVRYVRDEFAERLQLEQELIDELHPLIHPEAREQLSIQAERVKRLGQDLDSLAHQSGATREVARTARALLDALRLWYAEIEFGVGHTDLADVSPRVNGLLAQWKRAALAESARF